MNPVDISTGLRTVITILESSDVKYMIVGSIAGTVYGEPRLTHDLDLVLSLDVSTSSAFAGLFDPVLFYVPPTEIIGQEIVRFGHLNLLHHQSGLNVDLVFRKNTAHAMSEFSRRRRIEILAGLTAWVAAPEDIIIAKLRFFRECGSQKHITDIRGIVANSVLDRDYLNRWVASLGLADLWNDGALKIPQALVLGQCSEDKAFEPPTSTKIPIDVHVASKGNYYDIDDGLPQKV
jgi:hypothetical protein